MNKNQATIISALFSPIVSFAAIIAMLLVRNSEQSPIVWVIGFGFMIMIPMILGYIAIRKKVIGNWDISDRSQRPKALGILLIVQFLGMLIFKNYVSVETFQTLIFLFMAAVGFWVITLFWKISGHAMAIALATGLIVKWFGLSCWPVLLITPTVAWARVVRRDHTVWQVIAGVMYSWILVFLFPS